MNIQDTLKVKNVLEEATKTLKICSELGMKDNK